LNDDYLLKRLREQIQGDMAPVRPLRAPGIRALLPVAACLALGGLVMMVAGLRRDIEVIGAWRLLLFAKLQLAACAWLYTISLRWSIPAMGRSPLMALMWVPGGLLVQALFTAAILERSALAPPSGSEWRTGLACLTAIALISLAPLAAAALMTLRGLPMRLLAGFAIIGFASGLSAEAVWRVHCPYSAWGHVLPFHYGPLLATVLVAGAAAAWPRRRS
jgi:hypothetical protein